MPAFDSLSGEQQQRLLANIFSFYRRRMMRDPPAATASTDEAGRAAYMLGSWVEALPLAQLEAELTARGLTDALAENPADLPAVHRSALASKYEEPVQQPAHGGQPTADQPLGHDVAEAHAAEAAPSPSQAPPKEMAAAVSAPSRVFEFVRTALGLGAAPAPAPAAAAPAADGAAESAESAELAGRVELQRRSRRKRRLAVALRRAVERERALAEREALNQLPTAVPAARGVGGADASTAVAIGLLHSVSHVLRWHRFAASAALDAHAGGRAREAASAPPPPRQRQRGASTAHLPPLTGKLDERVLSLAPVATFRGSLLLASSARQADEALSLLAAERVLGMDTEWRPSFSKGARPRTALVQLCSATRCVIIQVAKIGHVPPRLLALLRDARVYKVGVGASEDISKLLADYGLPPLEGTPAASGGKGRPPSVAAVAGMGALQRGGALNLEQLTRALGMSSTRQSPGLKTLFFHFTGARLSKHEQMSNWERPTLTPAQIRYAATDAWASLVVYTHMARALGTERVPQPDGWDCWAAKGDAGGGGLSGGPDEAQRQPARDEREPGE